jgi:glycosyltransferase involved in cell wall biosynthesis
MPHLEVVGATDRSGILAALGRARVLAHPSSPETMSLAVLKGMSAGLPVLGASTLRDVVASGVEGGLVDESPETTDGQAAPPGPPRHVTGVRGKAARRKDELAYSWDHIAHLRICVYEAIGTARARVHPHDASGPRP